MSTSLFSLWAKTAASDHQGDSLIFHPLIYHLLDVAACADALLRQERARVERLANSCKVNADDLSSCFVALIALHDIGKCARGFQGKCLQLWPEFLGPRPVEELNVRHDPTGV
ncbi:MAG TPA: CRISPR-associated endonuclease Cas3'' [Xanthobacteraceae bacterium]